MIKDIINLKKLQEKEIDKLCEVFPCAYDSNIIDVLWKTLNLAIDNAEAYITNTPGGSDWIQWYLYEAPSPAMVTIEDKEYKVETPSDLYNIMVL